jgi:hypothetical protein
MKRLPSVVLGSLVALLAAHAAAPAFASCVEPEPDFPIALLGPGSSIEFLREFTISGEAATRKVEKVDQALVFQAGGPIGRIRHVEIDVEKPYCSVMTNVAPYTVKEGSRIVDALGPGEAIASGIRVFNPADFEKGPLRGLVCSVGAQLRRQGVRSLKVSQMKDVFGRVPIRVCLDPEQAKAEAASRATASTE